MNEWMSGWIRGQGTDLVCLPQSPCPTVGHSAILLQDLSCPARWAHLSVLRTYIQDLAHLCTHGLLLAPQTSSLISQDSVPGPSWVVNVL